MTNFDYTEVIIGNIDSLSRINYSSVKKYAKEKCMYGIGKNWNIK